MGIFHFQFLCENSQKGIKVADLTERSWHLNANSMATVVSRIRKTNLDSLSILVHDLFGNTSSRFRQADNTLSLAVKLSGEGVATSWGMSCSLPTPS